MVSRRQNRIIGVGEASGKTDRAVRRAARSATRANRATESAARAVEAASGRTGASAGPGRTDGTYGAERVSSAKLVLWVQEGEGNSVALLSTYLNSECAMSFRYYAESKRKMDNCEFWVEIAWFDKIIGRWDVELEQLETYGEHQVTGLLTWKAEDE